MIGRIGATLAVIIGATMLGCAASEPPRTEVCVDADDVPNGRIYAAYYLKRELVEIISDVPVEAGRACVTLRPPSDLSASPDLSLIEEWPVERGTGAEQPEDGRRAFPIWPIEVVLYADANDDQQAQPGEVRGFLSDQYGGAWAWTTGNARLKAYVERDAAWTAERGLGAFGYIYSGHRLNNTGEAHGWNPIDSVDWQLNDTHDDTTQFAVVQDCLRALPRCLPTVSRSTVYTHMIDPRLPADIAARVRRWQPEYSLEVPFRAVEKFTSCGSHLGGYVGYGSLLSLRLGDDCVCHSKNEQITAHTRLDAPPDWFVCDVADDDGLYDVVIGK